MKIHEQAIRVFDNQPIRIVEVEKGAYWTIVGEHGKVTAQNIYKIPSHLCDLDFELHKARQTFHDKLSEDFHMRDWLFTDWEDFFTSEEIRRMFPGEEWSTHSTQELINELNDTRFDEIERIEPEEFAELFSKEKTWRESLGYKLTDAQILAHFFTLNIDELPARYRRALTD